MAGNLCILICLLTAFSTSVIATQVGKVIMENYRRCPRLVSAGQQIDAVVGRSKLDCVVRCSRTSGCHGVNVCPAGKERNVWCTLIEEFLSSGCDGLGSGDLPECYFMQKLLPEVETTTALSPTTEVTTAMTPTSATAVTTPTTTTSTPKSTTTTISTTTTTPTTTSTTTTELVCQNGGTPNVDRCTCRPQYGGRTCHRLVRDCTEVFENGYTDDSYSGVYNIQPITAPAAFRVRCKFAWGVGIQYPYFRTKWSNFNKNWNDLKIGFGDPTSDVHFVGLDNLHHLLMQGSYQLHVWYNKWDTVQRHGSVFYDNFAIASEAEFYRLSYNNFYANADHPANDGFSPVAPVLFSAPGKDTNGCAGQRGESGWYGANCSTNSGLFATTLTWPRPNGEWDQPDNLEFNFVRKTQLIH